MWALIDLHIEKVTVYSLTSFKGKGWADRGQGMRICIIQVQRLQYLTALQETRSTTKQSARNSSAKMLTIHVAMLSNQRPVYPFNRAPFIIGDIQTAHTQIRQTFNFLLYDK